MLCDIELVPNKRRTYALTFDFAHKETTMNEFEERELEEMAATPEMEDKWGPIITDPMQKKIDIARKRLNERWREQGECDSCGWHAALEEHGVETCDIITALEDDGILCLPCLNKNEEYRLDHRGVKVYIGEENE